MLSAALLQHIYSVSFSEDDDFDDAKQAADTNEQSGVAKAFKFGLLSNFARLDFSRWNGIAHVFLLKIVERNKQLKSVCVWGWGGEGLMQLGGVEIWLQLKREKGWR